MKSNLNERNIIFYIILGIVLTFQIVFYFNLKFSPEYNYSGTSLINKPGIRFENLKISKISGKIHVDNNWSETKTLGICTGSGNFSDPFIIEDLVIDGEDLGSCILIENTIEYFKIENCTVFNCGNDDQDAGIKLLNITNGKLIDNNCISNNSRGISLRKSYNSTISENNATIYLEYSSNNTISGNMGFLRLKECNYNIISGNAAVFITLDDNSNNNLVEGNIPFNSNGCEIFVFRSDNNTISGNTVNYTVNGIILSDCFYNNISGNIMNKCGLSIGGSYEEISSHEIDNTNLVNGKPLYFYKNQENLGSDNFTNGGQVILVNCNESSVSNLNIFNTTSGVSLYYCNNVNFSGNIAIYNIHGLILIYNTEITVLDNKLNNNAVGIFLRGSNSSKISGNTVNNNIGCGISLENSNNNEISGNSVNYNNLIGIELLISNDNTLSGNNVNYNNGYGIASVYSNNNMISGNSINYNTNYGTYLRESNYNVISGNTMIGNNHCIIEDNCVGNTFRNNSGCFYGEPAINAFGNFFLFAVIFLVSMIIFNILIRDQRIDRKLKVYSVLISIFSILMALSYFFVNTTITDYLDPFNLNEFVFEFPYTITMNNFLVLLELLFFALSIYKIYKLDVHQAVLLGIFPCVLKGIEFFSMLFVLTRLDTFFNFYVELELSFYLKYLPWLGISYIYFVLFRSNYFKEISEEEQHVKIKELELRERIISKKEKLISPLFKFEEKKTRLRRNLNIYVSYADEDYDVFKIGEFMRRLSIFDDIDQVFNQGTGVNQEYFNEFENQIKGYDLMITFCSPNALKTPFLLKLWQKTKSMQMFVIPIYIEPQHIPRFLKSYKKVEFDAFNFEENLEKIHKIIIKRFQEN